MIMSVLINYKSYQRHLNGSRVQTENIDSLTRKYTDFIVLLIYVTVQIIFCSHFFCLVEI